jgi:hypothetical protein
MRKEFTLTEELLTHQEKLQISAEVKPSGEFEVLAITAGIGNGWDFTEKAIKESLSLWENVECFVDHSWFNRSVRDLAGVLSKPLWSDDHKGIKATLIPFGPSAALLSELGRQLLESDGPAPKIGFSADVLFTASGKTVRQILRVNAVDLVFNPARGGAFLRALNSIFPKELETMPTRLATEAPNVDNQQAEAEASANNSLASQLEADRQAVRTLLDEQTRLNQVSEEAEKARAVRAQMCEYLLDSALASARLPAPAAEQVRKQFAGQVFEPAELQGAISDARKLVSDLTAGLTVQGPGRISGMFSSEDQLTAAVHDLLGVERPDGLEGLRPSRLSGIRELYTMMTGDFDFVGGYAPDRVQLATTATLPGILKNAFNKIIINQWEELGKAGYRWWEHIVQVEHFNSLQSLTGVLVGEVTVLPSVSEGAAYAELNVADSPETASWGKYGGYIGLTLEMFERDETHKLRQFPVKLASAALRRISALVSSVFTDNSGVGPALADTYKVFDASNHSNLLTTALSSAAWEAASAAIYNQSMVVGSGGTAPKLALDAKYLLVPRALRLTGQRILYPQWEREANIMSENLQRGEYGDVLVVPEWTDPTDWAAVADPRLAPAIILGERFGLLPEIFIANNELGGALFTNDQIRIKVRHFVTCLVADYRPLHKNNVADG